MELEPRRPYIERAVTIPSETPPVDSAAAPEPDLRISRILLAGVGPYVGYTALIGVGIVMTSCFGIGLLMMWFGSAGLLERAARDVGLRSSSRGWIAGAWAVLLALLLGGCAYGIGFVLARAEAPGAALVVLPLGTLVFGAGLAPIALTPFASAAGVKGWTAPLVRAVDFAGSDRMLPLATVCGLVAVALLLPIPLVAVGAVGLVLGEPVFGALGLAAFLFWMCAVPVSGVSLTLRYRRLLTQDSAPSQLGAAAAPVLTGAVLGLVALAAALVVVVVVPDSNREIQPVVERLSGRITIWTQISLGIAACLFAGAVWWLGRVGASLRLLARPPFRIAGTLRVADADGVVFVPDNGLHAVRVPHRRIDLCPDAPDALAVHGRAELLSPLPIGGGGYRQSDVACPRGAMLMAGGTPEAALGRHLARARRLSFRVAVVGLVAMGLAAVSILAAH